MKSKLRITVSDNAVTVLNDKTEQFINVTTKRDALRLISLLGQWLLINNH